MISLKDWKGCGEVFSLVIPSTVLPYGLHILLPDHYMYVFGGYEEIIERFGQDVYRLDLTNLTWKLLVRTVFPMKLL